jgi:Phage integrase, N-terminal SAM-like domain/Phage integrase family
MTRNQTTKRRHRPNGDGSVYKRGDGYWVGAFYAQTASGARKRVVVYGKTLAEARDKLGQAQHQARAGIPVPDESWKVGPYLEYWLEHIVKRNRRPATYALYETNIRIYLIPGLGTKSLTRLSVPAVQMFLNQRLEAGDSVRKVQVMRSVLSAALSRAVREELITRNVARHIELPEWHRSVVRPWTAQEARRFMAASRNDLLHNAFVLLIVYGLRRGEVLGLSWDDIDFDTGTIHVRQQIQRVRGEPSSARSRPMQADGPSPCSTSPGRHSPRRQAGRPPTRPTWAQPGRAPASSSPPGPAVRWSRATSCGRFAASATSTTSG